MNFNRNVSCLIKHRFFRLCRYALSVSFNRLFPLRPVFYPTETAGQFRSFSPIALLKRRAALLPVVPVPASGNTQYGATQASLLLGNGMVSITDLTPIDLHRETMLPVPLNKGLATSIFYSHHINCRWVFAKLLT